MARGVGRRKASGLPGPSKKIGASHHLPAVPDVYQDMLIDALSTPSETREERRPAKRRRVGGRIIMKPGELPAVDPSETEGMVETDGGFTRATAPKLQTAYDDAMSSTESDVDWEEVDIKETTKIDDSEDGSKEINLVLGEISSTASKSITPRRKGISKEERKLRLDIHNMHLLCLFAHIHLRNYWCNDLEVQKQMKALLPKKTRSYLLDDEKQSQFQRSRSFRDGLSQACDIFRTRFKITARGINRSYWAEDNCDLGKCQLPDDIDLPTSIVDFRISASRLKASRDIGAQLFCAMLRSAGVETRLVSSLQPLPFITTAKGKNSVVSKPSLMIRYPETRIGMSDGESEADIKSDAETVVNIPAYAAASADNSGAATSRIRSRLAARLGRPLVKVEPKLNSDILSPEKKPLKMRIRESPYPIYWIEAFDAAMQKWTPVDPLVTKTIAKPIQLEPPASDIRNSMTYVIAFEDDGSARDVTRRYCKAYNAKTRKNRVEVTNSGSQWWRRVMRMYKRPFHLDQDQVEDAELAAKEAAEGMPKNVQDFKNHPYYALERHLRRAEVIHPKREVGKVAASKSDSSKGNQALEPIYRRQDVHAVKSADGWYRLGREIKGGEQPLKHGVSRRRNLSTEYDGSTDDEGAGTAMYTAFQTVTYTAPAVVRGRVPKNAYGNLDIYVSSMIPPGSIHVSHPDTARAARLLGIDYADAVTGFEFRGRHGTAVVNGAVVAEEFRDAIEAVIRGLQDEKVEAEEFQRSLVALRMWKRFLVFLRIQERVQSYKIEGESDVVEEAIQGNDMKENIEDSEGGGGGFLPDATEEGPAEPIAQLGASSPASDYSWNGGDEGGFMLDGDDKPASERTAKSDIEMRQQGKAVRSHSIPDGTENEDTEIMENIERRPGNCDITITYPSHHNSVKRDVVSARDKEQSTQSPVLRSHLSIAELEEATTLQELYESVRNSFSKKSKHSPPPSDASPAVQIAEASISKNEHNATLYTDKGEKTRPLEESQGDKELPPVDKVWKEKMVAPPEQERKEKRKASPDMIIAKDNDSDDRDSLLSHDPSDEDADPEWLV